MRNTAVGTCFLLLAACGSRESNADQDAGPSFDTNVPPRPVLVEVIAGEAHTCARSNDGGLWCWGVNLDSQLGYPAPNDCLAAGMPASCSKAPVRVPVAQKIAGVTLGGTHTCAWDDLGKLLCWGDNARGSLGYATASTTYGGAASPIPGLVPDVAGVVAAAAGETHTCSLSAGVLSCWGGGTDGELGDGSMADRLAPAPVTALADVVGIAVGAWHSCALRKDGTVHCWGMNDTGQVGRSSSTCRTLDCALAPVLVPGLADVTQLSLGWVHSCALGHDGTVSCWGANDAKQLGAATTEMCNSVGGATPCSRTPVAVAGLSNVVSIAAGGAHTCALRSDGAVLCWGSNGGGQLGRKAGGACVANGSTYPCDVSPQPVTNLGVVAQITAGGAHSCATTTAGTVWCWGDNTYGQIGDGSLVNGAVPTIPSW